MTRIAVISDIHANLEALKSVLADIETQNIDKIICLGDIIGKGVHAHECIELVKNKCDIVIKGNVDDRFCDDAEKFKDYEIEYKRLTYNQLLMTEEDMNYLRGLPCSVEFYLSGNLIRMFHANPNSFEESLNSLDVNFKNRLKFFEKGNFTITEKVADVVVFGHLHYQFMQKFYNRTLINSGSVGNSGCLIHDDLVDAEPKEITQAHYLILEGEEGLKEKTDSLGITFRSVNYDIESELKTGLNNPEFKDYEIELKEAKYRYLRRETEKLEKMGYKFDD